MQYTIITHVINIFSTLFPLKPYFWAPLKSDTMSIVRYCFALLLLAGLFLSPDLSLKAQPIAANGAASVRKPPYKVSTSGNQITVKCSKDIKTIMAWTATGSRILEKTIHASLFSFRVPTSHKMVFLRIELADGNTYSEKIGIN